MVLEKTLGRCPSCCPSFTACNPHWRGAASASGTLDLVDGNQLVGGFIFVLLAPDAYGQGSDALRLKTEIPYFFVKGGDAAVDALPINATQADRRI